MYKEAFSFIGEMLDMAAAGDKWGVLDAKENAMQAAGGDQYTLNQIEAAHDQALKVLTGKGVIKWLL